MSSHRPNGYKSDEPTVTVELPLHLAQERLQLYTFIAKGWYNGLLETMRTGESGRPCCRRFNHFQRLVWALEAGLERAGHPQEHELAEYVKAHPYDLSKAQRAELQEVLERVKDISSGEVN